MVPVYFTRIPGQQVRVFFFFGGGWWGLGVGGELYSECSVMLV